MLNQICPKKKVNQFLGTATLLSMGLLSLAMPASADTTTSDWSEWIDMNSISRATQGGTSQRDCLNDGLDFLRSRRASETGIIRESAYGRFGNLSAYLICSAEGNRVLVFISGPTRQYEQVKSLRRTLSEEFRRY